MFFNALLIIGLSKATEYDVLPSNNESKDLILEDTKMVFWRFRFWAVSSLGDFWSKPVITCPTCMASVHSVYVYWSWVAISGIEPFHFWLYILYIPALSGLVYIINSKIS